MGVPVGLNEPRRIVVDTPRGRLVLTDDVWAADDPGLQGMLRRVFNPDILIVGYDPDPWYTCASIAGQVFDGQIVEDTDRGLDPQEGENGRIY